ncbi:sugar transferase [Cryobacterium sp. TMT2-10]|uniref:sugar transferase n=1 Tax=Cryobacterium sp. TMT2-10 TaxID=1259244 RepID=UPI00106CFFEB|nr:sugar transferase [Cryobacterium sp. TMT2-10]TFD40331.1 sugar transferase [Cryobacterium sp. TMT2-10]
MRTAASLRRYDRAKRVLDFLVAAVALTVASPALVIIGGLVAVNLGRPVLFQQDRPGRNGRVFRLYKFRTMQDVDLERGLITDEERLTPFGRTLRATSLDELPTLTNVLKGEMSLVGPRPLLVRYMDRYTAEQSRRHEVRPGVTGLAQCSGRNALAWEAKFQLDIEYVENRSLFLDAMIIARTLRAVLARDGVTAEGHASMPEFGEEPEHAGK